MTVAPEKCLRDCLFRFVKVDTGMRLAHDLVLEGLSEVIRNADVALQHDFLTEYEKIQCDSASGVGQSDHVVQGDWIGKIPEDF